ncbi:hypothetical protein Ocin01_16240 [Orchesella cincta]|uniref:Secreted protein n=1 Tax=Orchesella cincta TaxID=48709 RepID=A0A1D2MBZ7_ORCCI|nr:hypothetical protein Ocin01_16240 [Orchesella cincta]
MKLAILCLVVLGLAALSLSAPVEQAEEVALVAGENSDAAMNELEDPNCGPNSESGEASTMEQQDGSSGKGGKGKRKGRGGKKGGKGKGKGKGKDEESTDSETTE